MVVRDDQAVRRDEAAGPTAVETHGRQPGVLQPAIRQVEAVLVFEVLARRVVEEPHTFVGVHSGSREQEEGEHKENTVHGGLAFHG